MKRGNKYAKELREDGQYSRRVVPLKQRQRKQDIRIKEELEMLNDDIDSQSSNKNDVLRSTDDLGNQESNNSDEDLGDSIPGRT